MYELNKKKTECADAIYATRIHPGWTMQVCFETRQEIITNCVRGAILVADAAGAEFRRAQNLDMAVCTPSHVLKLDTACNRG